MLNKALLWAIALAALSSVAAEGQAQLPPIEGFEAFDTPSDAGGSITLIWPRIAGAPAGSTYRAFIAAKREGPYYLAAETASDASLQSEDPGAFGYGDEAKEAHFLRISQYETDGGTISLENDATYHVRLELHHGKVSTRTAVITASAEGNYFNWEKLNNAALGLLLSVLIIGYISLARRRALYIRRIGGLEALDEALGRATEMGKPVLFIHGLRDMSQISTIAAVNILGRVARRTAEYDTALRVVAPDPVVMSVSQETVQASYFEAGRPDAFNPDHVFVAGTEQFSYAAATEGIMVRERPAAHIMMGYFYAESLLLAETGSTTGAIQIAGTDAFTQLPFFVTTCDYTLLGEELYAASAYLSREPKLLGSLKGQDAGKAILIAVIVLGSLLATLDIPFLTHLFTPH